MTGLQTREQMLAGLTVPTVAAQQMGWDDPAFRMEWNLNGEAALPSSPVSDLVERLEKRAKEDEECAENNRVVADLLSPELAKFNGRDEAGWNTYAVRTAVDHRKSMERDSRYSTDLREAASALTTLTTLSTRNAELEREVKRLREALFVADDTIMTLHGCFPLDRVSKEDVRLNEAAKAIRSFTSDDYYERKRIVDAFFAALSTSPQGGEHE